MVTFRQLEAQSSPTLSPIERVKFFKLAWDAIGSEFGARYELYEINWSGSTEENRLVSLNVAQATAPLSRITRTSRSKAAPVSLAAAARRTPSETVSSTMQISRSMRAI